MKRLKFSVCTLNYIQSPKKMNPAPINQVGGFFFSFVALSSNKVKLKYVSSIFSLAYRTFSIPTAFLERHRMGLFMFLCVWSTTASGVIP